MYELDNDVILIGVSDVHIGASINHHENFINFLNHVNEDPKNLQAIIILGDFFDIIMESVRDYCKKIYYVGERVDYINQKTRNYEGIFKGLKELKKKGINVYFTLGNHEIKILGNLDKWFYKRKEKLINEFEKNGFQYLDIFSLDHIWQYFILTAEEGKWKLGFYDTKKDIIKKKEENIYHFEDISAPDLSFNCLMTHGIQFETVLRKYGGGIPWYLGLKSPDAIKELGNLLWNEMIKLSIRTIEAIFDNWLAESRRIMRGFLKVSLISPFLILVKMFDRLLNMVVRKRKKLKNELYIRQVQNKFYPKLVKMGYKGKLNKVIFGHTHKNIKRSDLSLNDKKTKESWKTIFANSGAWQQIDIPSLIEINNNGEINVVELREKEFVKYML